MSNKGWIGVDLDGTLAHYEGWNNGEIGSPIPAMVERVKKWLEEDKEVRIVTARVSPLVEIDGNYPYANASNELIESARAQGFAIQEWCLTHIGQVLQITCIKDFNMIELWDDRVVRVRINEGNPCCDYSR